MPGQGRGSDRGLRLLLFPEGARGFELRGIPTDPDILQQMIVQLPERPAGASGLDPVRDGLRDRNGPGRRGESEVT